MKSDKMRSFWGRFAAVLIVFIVVTTGSGLCSESKKVAVIPFFINSPQDLGFLQDGLFNMLLTRLSDPGKVNVIDRETIDNFMTKAKAAGDIKGMLNESKARGVAAGLGADYILFGSLTHFGESVSLDASMVDVTGQKPTMTFFEQSNRMGDVIPLVNTFAGDINLKVFHRSIDNELYQKPQPQVPAAPGALQYADGRTGGYGGGLINLRQTGGKGFQTHLRFKGQINAMAAGAVTKDGTVRIVTATDYEILIHKLEGIKLVVEKKLEFSSTHRIVSLDIADINNNGYPEIFVTSLNIHREGLNSFVLEYNGSTYTTLTDDEPYYFRVMDGENQSKILIGQESGGHPFHGDIYTMAPDGNRYTPQKRLLLPRSASALSLAKGPVTADDASEYVLINEHGRLTVANDAGTVDWEGNKTYGGTGHYFLLKQNDPDASYQPRAYLHPRILFYDAGDDGKTEIFAVKNNEFAGGLGRYKRFENGSVEILSWKGISLAPVFKTKALQGWISDFAIADINGDGKKELIVSVVGKPKFVIGSKGANSSIISYALQ